VVLTNLPHELNPSAELTSPAMAIEFRCIRCGQLLRVRDDDQGNRARCPTCNAIVDIPGDDVPATPIVMHQEKSDVIDYELFGEESQYVEITLDPGEITVAKADYLLYMSPGIAMETAVSDDSGGGLLERISQVGRRMVSSGSSLKMTAFCNVAEQREVVAFAPPQVCRLVPLHLDEFDGQVFCQSDSILCVARGIEIAEVEVTSLSDVLTMQRITGDGIAVLHSPGQLFHRELKANKQIGVKTASVVAFTANIKVTPYELHGVEEETSVSTVTGPGEVWLKTATI